MDPKAQVFISSTYEDLREERQAAVEAILKAGHIPAGMELFTAGSASQLDVIKRWIEESDIFLLILGGRYGSIEPVSGKSYVEIEFEYARQLGKPFFSVVLSDQGREERVRARGTAVLEQAHEANYREFRQRVCSQLCAFFASIQDVKLAVFETLPQLAKSSPVAGWVRATDAQPSKPIIEELAKISEENRGLREQVASLSKRLESKDASEPTFEELFVALSREMVTIPGSAEGKDVEASLLEFSLHYADDLARGVSNAMSSNRTDMLLFFHVASPLAVYGLVEHAKTPASVQWQRLKLSSTGVKFFRWAKIKESLSNPPAAAKKRTVAKKKPRKKTAPREP